MNDALMEGILLHPVPHRGFFGNLLRQRSPSQLSVLIRNNCANPIFYNNISMRLKQEKIFKR